MSYYRIIRTNDLEHGLKDKAKDAWDKLRGKKNSKERVRNVKNLSEMVKMKSARGVALYGDSKKRHASDRADEKEKQYQEGTSSGKSKYKGGFINGKNSSAYNHDYYLHNKSKWGVKKSAENYRVDRKSDDEPYVSKEYQEELAYNSKKNDYNPSSTNSNSNKKQTSSVTPISTVSREYAETLESNSRKNNGSYEVAYWNKNTLKEAYDNGWVSKNYYDFMKAFAK